MQRKRHLINLESELTIKLSHTLRKIIETEMNDLETTYLNIISVITS